MLTFLPISSAGNEPNEEEFEVQRLRAREADRAVQRRQQRRCGRGRARSLPGALLQGRFLQGGLSSVPSPSPGAILPACPIALRSPIVETLILIVTHRCSCCGPCARISSGPRAFRASSATPSITRLPSRDTKRTAVHIMIKMLSDTWRQRYRTEGGLRLMTTIR